MLLAFSHVFHDTISLFFPLYIACKYETIENSLLEDAEPILIYISTVYLNQIEIGKRWGEEGIFRLYGNLCVKREWSMTVEASMFRLHLPLIIPCKWWIHFMSTCGLNKIPEHLVILRSHSLNAYLGTYFFSYAYCISIFIVGREWVWLQGPSKFVNIAD